MKDSGTFGTSTTLSAKNIVDYITGREVLDTPKERVRQKVERFLVEEKNYPKENIVVDYSFLVDVDGKKFLSVIDLLIQVEKKNFINIECAPPTVFSSLERKTLANSRIFEPIIPITVLTDWKQTNIYETFSGELIGKSLKSIPDFEEAKKLVKKLKPIYLDRNRLLMEKRILFAFIGILHCKCRIFE